MSLPQRKGQRGAGGASLGGRVLLGDSIRDGVDPPEELEPDVLIRGMVHWIYGEAGVGKTALALWLTLRVIERGEPVVYFDAENGKRKMVERLEAMGADPDETDRLLWYYPFPALNEENAAAYREMLVEVEPVLVVFDSLAKFLGAAGLEEDRNDDIIKWCSAYTMPARAAGITCAVLDHPGHNDHRPRGASRKGQEADVMWSVRCPKPFDRDTVGEIVLRREKDREAWLPERVKYSVGGTTEGFVFRQSMGTVQEPDDEGLTKRDRDVLAVLEDFGDGGASRKEWEAACAKPPLKLSRATTGRAILALGNVSHPVIRRGVGQTRRETRYFAVSGDSPDPPEKDGETRRKPTDKPKSGRVSRVSNMSHKMDETRGQPDLSHGSHHPYKGETRETGVPTGGDHGTDSLETDSDSELSWVRNSRTSRIGGDNDTDDPVAALLAGGSLPEGLQAQAHLAAEDPERHTRAFASALADLAYGSPREWRRAEPRVAEWLGSAQRS